MTPHPHARTLTPPPRIHEPAPMHPRRRRRSRHHALTHIPTHTQRSRSTLPPHAPAQRSRPTLTLNAHTRCSPCGRAGRRDTRGDVGMRLCDACAPAAPAAAWRERSVGGRARRVRRTLCSEPRTGQALLSSGHAVGWRTIPDSRRLLRFRRKADATDRPCAACQAVKLYSDTLVHAVCAPVRRAT
jgi:hypothetical protein